MTAGEMSYFVDGKDHACLHSEKKTLAWNILSRAREAGSPIKSVAAAPDKTRFYLTHLNEPKKTPIPISRVKESQSVIYFSECDSILRKLTAHHCHLSFLGSNY